MGSPSGDYRNFKTVQHSGAVYGFSTSLVVIPELRVAAIVLANADIAGGPVKRLSDAAIDLLLAVVRSLPLPEPPKPIELSAAELASFAGEYESTSYSAHLEVDPRGLRGTLSGQPIELTPVAPNRFLANGRIMNQSPFEFERAADGGVSGFTAAGQRFHRVKPAGSPPPEWQSLVGVYGERFIPLVVSLRHGHLYASIENEYDYRLTPLNRVTFHLPPGMYSDEQVVFQRAADGRRARAR